MNSLNDLLGVPIEVGDRIAYPGRRGSNVYMNVGTVTGFDTFYGTIRVKRTNTSSQRVFGREVTLTGYDRVVVLDKAIGPAPVAMDL
jgi:hypothetical protein